MEVPGAEQSVVGRPRPRFLLEDPGDSQVGEVP